MSGDDAPTVFVLGSINRDFVLKVERRPAPGETVTDADLTLHNGGKGANQAAAAALLGASVTFLGRVGDDGLGEPLVESLKRKNVDTSLVESVEGAATGAALITVTPDGENAIAVAPGANRSLASGDVEAVAGHIKRSRVVVAQLEIPFETVERASKIARSSGGRMLLNFAPARREAPRSLLEDLDPLVVNEHEAALLIEREVEGVDGALAAAGELLGLGLRSVVVTLGKHGAVCAEDGSSSHFPAPPVEAVDTTGAGDAFVGALAARLALGDDLKAAVAYAVKAGAAAVAREGAQGALPTREAVEEM